MRPQTWSQKLKKVSWLSKLFTRTLKLSRQEDFLDALTSSLAATRASHSVMPVSEEVKPTRGIYGRIFRQYSEKYGLFGVSSKMFEDTPEKDSLMYSEICTDLATLLNAEYSRRLNAEQVTDESDYSFWPTPRACDMEGGVAQVSMVNGRFVRTDKHGTQFGAKLRDSVLWPTPRCRDYKGDGYSDQLPNQVRSNTAMNPQERLNPDWVEQLMGLTVGWTAFDFAETE